MTDLVSAFQLGSSTVITIPKKLGIKPGQKMEVKSSGQKIILKRKKLKQDEIGKLINSLAGGLNLKKNLTPEKVNQELNRRYEGMLSGR